MPQLVTIGITAFNAEMTIERAVRSGLAQTWRPIEIVVVDDGSLDATPDILATLRAKHPEIRLFRHATNQGIAATRNRIIAEANGAFLAFFDDDDESLPGRISAQVNRLIEYEERFANGAPVVCHTARLQLYPDGSQRLAATMGDREKHVAPAGLPVAYRILLGTSLRNGYGACATCSQMARVSTYRNVGGFDPTLRRCSDTDFNIRVACVGGHFVGISRPLVIQTMTKTSEKSLAEEYRNIVILLNKHRDLIDRDGQYDFALRWVDAKQAWLEGLSIRSMRLLAGLLLSHPILTMTRLSLAVPNIGLNRAFRRFHLPDRG